MAGATTTTEAIAAGLPSIAARADPAVVVPYQQIVIVDRDRNVVRTYYRSEYAAGRCPPGWEKEKQRLHAAGGEQGVGHWPAPAAQIVYEPMPRVLWTQLTPPPYGYEYVRVADDIVLMSTATRVIAGLLGNLGNFSD